MFPSLDSFTCPPNGGLPPNTTLYQHHHAPPSPVTSIRSNSSWTSNDHPTASRYCIVDNHLKGCIHCEMAYRNLQRENHDLRKRMGEIKARLTFANENLRQEGARQRVLERCLAKLNTSLEEAQMRSVDVLEENHALRLDVVQRAAKTPASPRMHRPSPLDRQLEEQFPTRSPTKTTKPLPSPMPAPRSSSASSVSEDLATFRRTRETRKAAKKARAQRERHAAFAAIPHSFYTRSQQEPLSPAPSPGPDTPLLMTNMQSAKRLPRPSVLDLPAAAAKESRMKQNDAKVVLAATYFPSNRRKQSDEAVDGVTFDLARFKTAPA